MATANLGLLCEQSYHLAPEYLEYSAEVVRHCFFFGQYWFMEESSKDIQKKVLNDARDVPSCVIRNDGTKWLL